MVSFVQMRLQYVVIVVLLQETVSFTESSELPLQAPVFVQTLQNTVTSEGEGVHFKCIVTGYPVPVVRWYVDGDHITSSRYSILLSVLCHLDIDLEKDADFVLEKGVDFVLEKGADFVMVKELSKELGKTICLACF